MKSNLFVSSILFLVIGFNVYAADHDPKVIAPLLKNAKMTLLEGIEYAERTSGTVTSLKYEVSKGKLILSIYTVPEGLGTSAESATLTEVAGDVTLNSFQPVTEVFTDKEHIARASVHLTLAQMSPFGMREVIALALSQVPGTAIDVRNPMVRDRLAIAEVVIIDANQDAFTVTVDLLSGAIVSATQIQ